MEEYSFKKVHLPFSLNYTDLQPKWFPLKSKSLYPTPSQTFCIQPPAVNLTKVCSKTNNCQVGACSH